MKPCASCGRDGDLQPKRSALDHCTYNCCSVCIEYKAEPLTAVVHRVNGQGWCTIPPRLRRAIRIFDLEEYVSIPTWATRMSHRQVTLRRQNQEDQKILHAMKQRITHPPQSASPPSQPNRSQHLPILAWLGSN